MDIPEHPSDLGIATADGRDEWWPTQRETIQRIVDAFEEGKRFVFVNAPPGAGKTIVATAVQQYLDVRAVNLCHTIHLEKQYQRTCPWAKVVTGRSNHPCDLPPPMEGIGEPITAADAPCTQGVECDYQTPDGCSYYRMFFGAADTRQVVLNYAYACRILQTPFLRAGRDPVTGKRLAIRNPFYRELLVCDEGHLAEQAVVDAARVSFYEPSWLRHVKLSLPDSADVRDWVVWGKVALVKIDAAIERLPPVMQGMSRSALKDWSRLRSMASAAETVADIADPSEWMVVRDGKNAHVRPVWGWTAAERLLWGPFPKVMLQSATLGDAGLLARRLGIPVEQSTYIEVPSVFPAISRPTFYWPAVRVSRATTDADWDRLAQAIHYLVSQPNLVSKKGVIHTASFAVARNLFYRLERWDATRYITHAQARSAHHSNQGLPTFDQAMLVFEHAEEPLVMLSPSMTTGIDLPYIIGFQIIAKVPYGDLGDPVTAARRAYKPDWNPRFGQQVYDADALNTVVQATGRAVRTPTDQGVTYVLDGNFWALYARAYSPQSFRETVRWLKAK